MKDRMRAWFTPQMLAPDRVIIKELEGIAAHYDAVGSNLKVRTFDELMVESDKLQAELWRRAVERGMVDTRPAICDALFPQLSVERWGELNLDKLALDIFSLMAPLFAGSAGETLVVTPPVAGRRFVPLPVEKNPFLDPDFCHQWEKFIFNLKGIDYAWGGYLEDRSVVWAGHYHKPGEVTHLGVDFYVPARTWVHLPCEGTLVQKFQDPDQDGGWGGKLVFDTAMGYLILGHLRDMNTVEVGDECDPDKIVGVVAESEVNGGWSPHLHVQLMTKYDPKVDGYGKLYEGIELDFPNPIEKFESLSIK